MQLPPRHRPDFILLFVLLLLILIGLVMVYSASTVVALEKYDSSSHFFLRQVIWTCLGIVIMGFCMNIPFKAWLKLSKPMLLFSFLSLVAVLFTHANTDYGGKRWFHIGSLQIQPSEYAIISIILYISYLVTKKAEYMSDFKRGLLPPTLLIIIFAGLIGIEPDLGTAILLVGATFSVLFVAGLAWRYIGLLFLSGGIFVFLMTELFPFRMARITSFLNPWNDPNGDSLQVIQSFIAINSGGLLGRGLGRSIEKFLYLPESHTDFIFAILTEEWGWLGASVVLILFGVLIWRGILISKRIENRFAAYVSVGFTSLIATGVLINVGMVIGLLPVTGIPLPFISYGGTALVFKMAAMGIVLNISRYTKTNHTVVKSEQNRSTSVMSQRRFEPTVIQGKKSRFE
jgi:cell division protein FtsW